MEEAGKEVQAKAEETKKTIEGVLLPKQLERLKGLAMQMAGDSAIMDKEVQQDLKLSDDQVAKIKTANEEYCEEGRRIDERRGDPKTLGPKMQQLRADYEKQLMEVLTADQRELRLIRCKGMKFGLPTIGDLDTPPKAKLPAETKGQ